MDYRIAPCPHCGGDATLYSNRGREPGSYFVFVRCDICRSQGTIFLTYKDPFENDWRDIACNKAIRAWNRRYRNGEILGGENLDGE